MGDIYVIRVIAEKGRKDQSRAKEAQSEKEKHRTLTSKHQEGKNKRKPLANQLRTRGKSAGYSGNEIIRRSKARKSKRKREKDVICFH